MSKRATPAQGKSSFPSELGNLALSLSLCSLIRLCGSFEEAAWNELVAQLVEQRPFKAWVLGSSPSELTILKMNGLALVRPKPLKPTRDPALVLLNP